MKFLNIILGEKKEQENYSPVTKKYFFNYSR